MAEPLADWELADPRRMKELPEPLQKEIRATLAIGANVLTYATNRELREKLDAPPLVVGDREPQPQARGTLYVAKLQHTGGSDDAPAALGNLLKLAGAQLQLRVSAEKHLIAPTDPSLPEYPVAFLHGRRSFQFSPADRAALAQFVAQGGMIVADAICASPNFAEALRRELRAAFPDHPWQPIPPEDPLLSPAYRGFDITTVRLRDPRLRSEDNQPLSSRVETIAPVLEGIEIEGRWAVVFSPYDLSCALLLVSYLRNWKKERRLAMNSATSKLCQCNLSA